MPNLSTDSVKCENCGKCEQALPTFQRVHKGKLYISWARMRDSILVQESVKYVIESCPNGAISLDRG